MAKLLHNLIKLITTHLSPTHLLHNLHAMQENLHGRNREKIGGPLFVFSPTRSDEGLTFKTLAFQIFLGGNSTFNNSFQ